MFSLYSIHGVSLLYGRANMRIVEIFSAGCPLCEETIELVNRIKCHSCQVTVLDLHDKEVTLRAKSLGIKQVPAVLVDGKPVDHGTGTSPDELALRAAGIGRQI